MKNVLILCGDIGTGKTTALREIVDGLRADGRRIAGILSPAVLRGKERIGYDLIDLSDGRRTELSRIAPRKEPGSPFVGRFTFREEGLRAGRAALSTSAAAAADVVVVDEVGPWELANQGWAGSLQRLARETDTPMIWVVRSGILDRLKARWALQAPRIILLSASPPGTPLLQVREWLDQLKNGGGNRKKSIRSKSIFE